MKRLGLHYNLYTNAAFRETVLCYGKVYCLYLCAIIHTAFDAVIECAVQCSSVQCSAV